jgi:hypothetical protein
MNSAISFFRPLFGEAFCEGKYRILRSSLARAVRGAEQRVRSASVRVAQPWGSSWVASLHEHASLSNVKCLKDATPFPRPAKFARRAVYIGIIETPTLPAGKPSSVTSFRISSRFSAFDVLVKTYSAVPDTSLWA